jgi:hypothetical protein
MCSSIEAIDVQERAFICLHESHDVRRVRDHDCPFERVSAAEAESSVEMTVDLGPSILTRGESGFGAEYA